MSTYDIPETYGSCLGTANLIGVVLSTITFGEHSSLQAAFRAIDVPRAGVHIALFVQLNRIYYHHAGDKQLHQLTRRDWRLLAYTYVLFLLATAGMCLQTWVNHDAFVVHAGDPGGPLVYLSRETRHPAHVAAVMLYIVLNWFTDGMLLYRSWVLSRYSRYMLVGCCAVMLTLFGVGGTFVHTVAVSGMNLWTHGGTASCVAYLSLSFAINFVLTFWIVFRLLSVRREIARTLGLRYARVYTSLAAMLVESASLYTVVTLLSIITCVREVSAQNALLPLLGQLQAIPPLLIIVRVMEGRAVTAGTWQSTLAFQDPRSASPCRSSIHFPTDKPTFDFDNIASDDRLSQSSSPPPYGELQKRISLEHGYYHDNGDGADDDIETQFSRPMSFAKPSLRLSIEENPSLMVPVWLEEAEAESASTATAESFMSSFPTTPRIPPEAHTPRCTTCISPWKS
ncbi:hypothetical protein C8Q77DRAFT_1054567 [Trametes polyzona]|nr:hypothetical protein C8Q77DRAFT_1054567 [Trametes polyzona]